MTQPFHCPNGSQVIPGVQANATLASVNLDATLVLLGVQPEVAAVVAVALATADWAVATICSSDPPAQPAMQQSDLDAIQNPADILAYVNALAKWKDWFVSWYWYQVCQCTGVSTPAPPALVGPPPQSNNPGLGGGQAGVNCWTSTIQVHVPPNPSTVLPTLAVPGILPGQATQPTAALGNSSFTTALLLPPSSFNVIFTGYGAGGGPGPVAMLRWFNSAGTELSADALLLNWTNQAPSATLTESLPAPPSGATAWRVEVLPAVTQAQPGALPWDLSLTLSYACSSNPNAQATPCCPPDPLLDQKLNQIINLILTLNPSGGGTSPPTSWKDGTTHTSLSGFGSIAIDPQATGIRVQITQFPPSYNLQPGSPNFYWDMGFITPSVLGSPLRGSRLVFQTQSFQLPAFTDTVDWTLRDQQVISITELLPV